MSNIINKNIFIKNLVPEKEILGTKYDYSKCAARMDQYAFVCPTNGEFKNESGMQQIADNRTQERFDEYKACGFDVLLILGNDKYTGEEFSTSQLKKNLDMAEKAGLKTVVYDSRLHDLSARDKAIVGDVFSTFEELVSFVKDCMTPYMNHPAFYGVTLFDEPRFMHLPAVGEITRAVKAVDEKIFVHTCLLPYFASVDYGLLDFRSSIDGADNEETTTAYKRYISEHLKRTGASYVAYDNYPIFYSRGETTICFTYFHNLQMTTNVAKSFGAKVDLTIQTYADFNTEMRWCDEDDIRFQAMTALSFGCCNISYFTYWMFPWRPKNGICQAIMDDYGNKLCYYETQRVNALAQKLYAVTSNFEYVGTNLYTTGEEPQLFELVERTDFEEIKGVKASVPTLLNGLYDKERDVKAFMIVNASDPFKKLNDQVEITFNGKSKAVVYINGTPEFVNLEDGVLSLNISCGDGVLIIPVD